MRSGRLHTQNVQEVILQNEREFLTLKGPTLSLFSENSGKRSALRWQPKLVRDHEGMIKLPKDSNANIRGLYYCILHLMFDCEETELSRHTLQKLKLLVYSPGVRLDWLKPKEIEPEFRDFYDNRLFKKIFVEFLQVLEYRRGRDSIMSMLHSHPILDLILILVMRAIYISAHRSHLLRESSLQDPIESHDLILCFQQKLDILIPTEVTRGALFTLGGLSFYDCGTYCLLVDEKKQEQNQEGARGPATCESIDLSEVGSSLTEFSEVLNDDWNPEVTGEPTSEFKQLNALYTSKFRKLRDSGESKPRQIAASEIVKPNQSFNGELADRLYTAQNEGEAAQPTRLLQFTMSCGEKNRKDSEDSPTIRIKKNSHQEPKRNRIQQIYDGLTSPELINLLKPEIKKEINEKRKQSIMKVMKSKTDFPKASQQQFRPRMCSDMMPTQRRFLPADVDLNFGSKSMEIPIPSNSTNFSSSSSAIKSLGLIDPSNSSNIVSLTEARKSQQNLNGSSIKITIQFNDSRKSYQNCENSKKGCNDNSLFSLVPEGKNQVLLNSPPRLQYLQPRQYKTSSYISQNSSSQPSTVNGSFTTLHIPLSHQVIVRPSGQRLY